PTPPRPTQRRRHMQRSARVRVGCGPPSHRTDHLRFYCIPAAAAPRPRRPYPVCMSPFATELAAARAAQQLWGRLGVRDRLRPVRALRNLLVERTDDLCAMVAADIARPAVEVLASELLPTAAALKFLE